MGLKQYAGCFGANLCGAKLVRLGIAHLPQLGVLNFDDQKNVLRCLEQLKEALAALEEERLVVANYRRHRRATFGGCARRPGLF